jgi:hypothetical protein
VTDLRRRRGETPCCDGTGLGSLAWDGFPATLPGDEMEQSAVVMGLSLRSVDSRAAWFLLTVPVLLLLIAAVAGYQLWRSPYENRDR